MKTIKEQMRIGRILVDMCNQGGRGNAVIAGGAPRDWYFGNQADDIDVFITVPEGFTTPERWFVNQAVRDMRWKDNFNRVIPDRVGEQYTQEKSFYEEGDLLAVHEDLWNLGDGRHQRVQFVFTKMNVYNLINNHFPLNLSRAWFDGVSCHYDTTFLEGATNRAIVYRPDTARAYLEKVWSKFPHFAVVPEHHRLAYV